MTSVGVVVVEDDESIAMSLTRILEARGYEAQWARTGAEALKIAALGISIVLLDLGLPDRDGVEICREIFVPSRDTDHPRRSGVQDPRPCRPSRRRGTRPSVRRCDLCRHRRLHRSALLDAFLRNPHLMPFAIYCLVVATASITRFA